jgi:antitoxin CptB
VGCGYGFINPYPLLTLGWLMEPRLARLRWRCRRGMRELDALLLRFVDTQAEALGEDELVTFEAILELPDPVLHSYLLGRSAPTEDPAVELVERIRAAVDPDA